MSKLPFDSFNLFSPPITLFYNKNENHSGLSSFILTILGLLTIIFFIFYYFILMINRQKFTAYTYDGYSEIAPVVTGNKTGFFHYYTFDITEPNDKYITITGYDSNNIYEYIYGKCTEENMEGFENLILNKEKFLNYGYCIKKSVKLSDGNITLVTDKNFVWPTIAEGGNYYYYFEVKKCSNTSNLFTKEAKVCASEEEINKYLENEYGATVYALNNYVDVGKFKNPITTYFYDLDLQIGSQTYLIYHLNYDLGLVNSHENLFTDTITKTNTLIFNRLDSATGEKIENKTDDTMALIFFWRSPKIKVYERIYNGLLTFFSDIGGIFQIINRICSLIDIYFSGYAKLIDSKILYNKIKKKAKRNSKDKNSNKEIKDIISSNNEIQSKSTKGLTPKNIVSGISNNSTNKIKNINMDDKNIGFFEYLYYLFFGRFYCSKDTFKYLDVRKKILSEEFLYQLYFQKNAEKFSCPDDSKENLIIPDDENMNKYFIKK